MTLLTNLIRVGVIIPKHGRKIDKSYRIHIDPKDIEALFDKMRTQIYQKRDKEDVRYKPVNSVIRFKGQTSACLSPLKTIQLVLAGHLNLAPEDKSKHGLEAFRMYESDVTDFTQISAGFFKLGQEKRKRCH